MRCVWQLEGLVMLVGEGEFRTYGEGNDVVVGQTAEGDLMAWKRVGTDVRRVEGEPTCVTIWQLRSCLRESEVAS